MRYDRYKSLNGRERKIYYTLGIIETLIIFIITIAIIPVAIIWKWLSIIRELPADIVDSLWIRRNEWFITKRYRNYKNK